MFPRTMPQQRPQALVQAYLACERSHLKAFKMAKFPINLWEIIRITFKYKDVVPFT